MNKFEQIAGREMCKAEGEGREVEETGRVLETCSLASPIFPSVLKTFFGPMPQITHHSGRRVQTF